MKLKKIEIPYLIFIFLASFCIANPFIFYLLFNNILFSILPFIASTFLLYSFRLIQKVKWIFIYLINFLMIFSIWAHLEVVFKYNFSDYIIEDLYSIRGKYYINKANLNSYLEDKEYKSLYRTNDQGFRIGEGMQMDKKVSKCDWLFVGDSYTQGAQVNFEDLFTTKLFDFFPDKIILNAGMSGYGLPEIFNYLKNEGILYKPKKVFIQVCNFNDFMKVEESTGTVIDYLMEYSDLIRFLFYNIQYKSPDELPLGRWTEPFCKKREDNMNFNVFFKPTSESKKRDLKEFKNFIAKISNWASKSNIDLVVFQVPTKEQIYYKYFSEVINNFNINVDELDMSFPNKYLMNICDSLGIKYIDLTDGLIDYPTQVFFDYDEHFNKEGHKAVAKILYDELKQKNQQNNLKLLSKNFFGDRYPSLCFDDSLLFFQSFRHNNMELFKTDTSFTATIRLTNNDIDESHPSVSADGKYLVFTEGNAESYSTNIVLMNLNNIQRINITWLKNEYGAIPKFSNDFKKVVYAGWSHDSLSNTFTNPQIVSWDMPSNIKKVLVDNKYENWRPIFSPKDTSIAYISKRNGNFDLFLLNLKTKVEKQLTFTLYDEWDPYFSSDGNKIIYTAKKFNNWDLFEYNFNNNNVYQITNTLGNEWDPIYSKDGHVIYYGGEYGLMNGIFSINLKQ